MGVNLKHSIYHVIRSIYRALPISLEAKSAMKAKVMPFFRPLSGTSHEGKSNNYNLSFSKYQKFPEKDAARRYYRSALLKFLEESDQKITLPSSTNPNLSVVIVLYNQAELTLACLKSLEEHLPQQSEVILIDNASSDETGLLLQRVYGAIVIQNGENLHFLRACNQVLDLVKGEYLLLLNNDAQILSGTVEKAITVLSENRHAGAVGGRIINLDGALQEAGSIIWRDGSCYGYGRGDHPDRPEYRFRRSVDYCSGAFLLTRTALFQKSGGFDEAFSPAYYEETDYCVRLWEGGYPILYDPDVVLYHFEFGSGSSEHANALMENHKDIFVQRHTDYLRGQLLPDSMNILFARSHSLQPRILYVDDRIPRPRYGSGFPRACRIVHELCKQALVTIYCTNHAQESWEEIYADIPKDIEVMRGWDASGLSSFLRERAEYYDIIWVSRPHNMAHISRLQKADLIRHKTRIIYDAEALISFREQERAILQNGKAGITEQEEMRLAAAADLVLAVSATEADLFRGGGVAECMVLGHSMEVEPTPASFSERSGFLFVGALPSLDCPNGDSLLWFSKTVWPLIRQSLGHAARLDIVGYMPNPELFTKVLAQEGIHLIGSVQDLTSYYNASRVVIIPTRFAAGIPMKAHDAAAAGVPFVTSELIASQLGWEHGKELLQAPLDAEAFAASCVRLYQDEALWNMLRNNALQAVIRDTDAGEFRSTIEIALQRFTRATAEST
ncbi:glycosyltransferase [Acidithiobacillus sp. AC3]